jgi:hypothetical protein
LAIHELAEQFQNMTNGELERLDEDIRQFTADIWQTSCLTANASVGDFLAWLCDLASYELCIGTGGATMVREYTNIREQLQSAVCRFGCSEFNPVLSTLVEKNTTMSGLLVQFSSLVATGSPVQLLNLSPDTLFADAFYIEFNSINQVDFCVFD